MTDVKQRLSGYFSPPSFTEWVKHVAEVKGDGAFFIQTARGPTKTPLKDDLDGGALLFLLKIVAGPTQEPGMTEQAFIDARFAYMERLHESAHRAARRWSAEIKNWPTAG